MNRIMVCNEDTNVRVEMTIDVASLDEAENLIEAIADHLGKRLVTGVAFDAMAHGKRRQSTWVI